jgi:hypothetical protein
MEIRRANPANPETLWDGDVDAVPRIGEQVDILDDAGYRIAHQCTAVCWVYDQDSEPTVTVSVETL